MKDAKTSLWEKAERIGFFALGLLFLSACFRSV